MKLAGGGYSSISSFVRTDGAASSLLSTLCERLQSAFQSTCVGYFREMLKIPADGIKYALRMKHHRYGVCLRPQGATLLGCVSNPFLTP